MSLSEVNTILLVGGTSGIGAGLASRLHAAGKKVIVTGRRQDRLAALEQALPGLYTSEKHPDIDSVIIAAGIQLYTQLDKPETVSPESISEEIATNLTGPIVLSNLFVSFFLSQKKASPTSIVFTTSGLAIAPFPVVSVYSATKSALHSYALSLRSLLFESRIKVVEMVPQFVADTELALKDRDLVIAALGGPDSPAAKGLPLQQCLDEIMAGLAEGRNEFGVGRADMILKTWRSAVEPVLQRLGVKG